MVEEGRLLLALGLILLIGVVSGQLAHRVRLPHITGQILAGVLIGHLGLSFLGPDEVSDLTVVTDFALGLIALMMGENLNLRTLRNAGRRLTALLLLEAIVTPALVFGVGYAVYGSPWLPLLLASMAISTAPATVVALIKERRAKGVFVKTLTAAVALNNIASIVFFAIARAISHIGFAPETTDFQSAALVAIYQVGISVLLGLAAGFVLVLATRRLVRSDRLWSASIVALLVVVGASLAFDLSLLLSCLTLGFTITNLTPERSELGGAAFEHIETAIFAAFFTMAGMKLNITNLETAALMVGVVVITRAAGKLLVAEIAMRISHATENVRRNLGLALLPQAGPTVGLILLVQQDAFLEPIAQVLLVIGLTSVLVNEVAGSVTCDIALKRSGEVDKDRPRLIDFIGEHNIVVDIKPETKEEAIEQLTDVLIRTNGLNVDRDKLLQTFLDRERESSTAVGSGLAIPHGILPEGKRMYGVMGLSREGLDLDTPDGRPVHCIFLLATPDSQRERHLEVIAALARAVGRDKSIQERLFNAKTAAHAYEILHAEETSETFNYYLESN